MEHEWIGRRASACKSGCGGSASHASFMEYVVDLDELVGRTTYHISHIRCRPGDDAQCIDVSCDTRMFDVRHKDLTCKVRRSSYFKNRISFPILRLGMGQSQSRRAQIYKLNGTRFRPLHLQCLVCFLSLEFQFSRCGPVVSTFGGVSGAGTGKTASDSS